MSSNISVQELIRTQKLKPEYSGVNHPLYVPESYRVERGKPQSARAQSAINQFAETGKAELPTLSIKRGYPEPPISTKPIRKAEPLEYVIADVAARLDKIL